jgi:hypothetical protein
MAIKTKYNFKGIEVKDAYIRIDRLFGSSKEGWTALVGAYNITVEEVPVVEAVKSIIDEDGVLSFKGVEAYRKEVYNLIEEFNHSASYVADERGYVSVYKSLMDKFGGEEI